jgi:hypothetical protein
MVQRFCVFLLGEEECSGVFSGDIYVIVLISPLIKRNPFERAVLSNYCYDKGYLLPVYRLVAGSVCVCNLSPLCRMLKVGPITGVCAWRGWGGALSISLCKSVFQF